MDVSSFDSTQKKTSVSPGKTTGLSKEGNSTNMLLLLSCLDRNENFLLDCTSSNRGKELHLIETLTYLTSAKARSTKLSSSRPTVTKNVVLQN
jgi:hypothetical protein